MLLLARIDRLARGIEERPIPLAPGLVAFGTVVLTRHLLEILAGQNPVYSPLQFLVHYPLAYAAPFLALVLVLHLASGVAVPRLSRLMLHVWALTLLPPLADLVAGGGAPGIGYMQPGFMEGRTILTRFLDPRVSFVGTTSGIRLETALACALGALYVVMTRSRRAGEGWLTGLRAAAAIIGVYLTALGFFTLPLLASSAAESLLDPRRGPLFGAPRILSVTAPVALTTADQACILYLVPLCLALACIALRRSGIGSADRRVSLADRFETLTVAARGLIAAALGTAAGAAVRGAIDGGLPIGTPLDLGALLALPVAAALTEVGALRLTRGGEHPLICAVPALGGLALALSAGSAPALLLLVPLLLALARRTAPLDLDRWPLLGAVAAGIGAIGSLGAGSSWALGTDALALLPPALVLAVGLIAGSAAALGSTGRSPAPARPTPGPILALVLLLTMGLGLGAALAMERPRSLLVGSAVSRPKWIVRRGMAAEAAGQSDQARALYRRALTLDPTQALVHARLGELLLAAGQAEAAATSLAEAVALAPTEVPARQQLAMIHLAAGRRNEAVELLRSAVALAPRDPVVAWSLAQALTRPPALPDAASSWQRYLEISASLPAEASHRDEARAQLRALIGDP